MKKAIALTLSLILMSFILVIPIRTSAATPDASAGAVTTGGSRLNVRASPKTDGTWLASLTDGSYVTLLSQNGSWWHVEYAAGKTGYCHKDYITPIAGKTATVKTGGSSLNVRSGPGTAYARRTGLADGTVVLVLSVQNGWARVLYHGTSVGYVSTAYLAEYAVAYPKVSLPVPAYRQWDSRWGWVKIGSQGKTLSQIGCATTGIAMIESYRKGYEITPGTMAGRLSYTASGNVYWPSDYTAIYTSAGYLDRIYRELSAGRAVLLGAKTASGGQHWIVITGYTGGDTLTPGGFTINDPGVATRKTLADFFEDYPYFYKYFVY